MRGSQAPIGSRPKRTIREGDNVAVQNPEGGEKNPWVYGKVSGVHHEEGTIFVAVGSGETLTVNLERVTVCVLCGDDSV